MQDDQYHRGLATRREVMGDPFVDRALAGTTPFTQPIQDHISRAAWGDVWQRPVWTARRAVWSLWPC